MNAVSGSLQSTKSPDDRSETHQANQGVDKHKKSLSEKVVNKRKLGKENPDADKPVDVTAEKEGKPSHIDPEKGKDTLVATSADISNKMPAPNEKGAVGAVPLEDVRPAEFAKAPSRKQNLYDTSLDLDLKSTIVSAKDAQKYNKLSAEFDSASLFPWRSISEFNSTGKPRIDLRNSGEVKDYIVENFYSDWYSNVANIVGTCFFSWWLADHGFSWWSLSFVFFCSAAVYNCEYTRFNRNIRDDLTRATVYETLSDRVESTLWLNTFLSKFWVIYMPVLSQQVKDQANPILSESAPGYGIEALSLEHFTLGSKAPAIRAIKTNTKCGKDLAEVEMSFAFTPSDVSEMTPKEAKSKINPKVVLGVTLGKSFVSKTMSVITEDINVSGRVRVLAQFGPTFPNIKIVSVQLMEPPLIDFVLKPVGGDTLGLDVMSFLPGLKSFVKSMINSNIGPLLIAPNKLDIDIEELFEAQSNEAVGVLVVTVAAAANLKSSEFITNTVDPYVVMHLDNPTPGTDHNIRTSIKSDVTDPRWNETKYILVNSLEQKMTFDCYDFNDVRKDTLIGTTSVDLKDLWQNPVMDNVTKVLKLGTHTRGTLDYTLRWFPVIKDVPGTDSDVVGSASESDSEEVASSDEMPSELSDVGIAKLTLQTVKDLDVKMAVGGSLSPSAELNIDGKLVKRYRTLKKTNEPTWNETIECFIPSKSTSKLEFKVFDMSSKKKVLLCSSSSSLEEVLNVLYMGQENFKASPQGQFTYDVQWKPIKADTDFVTKSLHQCPLGAIRLNIKDAAITEHMKGVGDIDPYFTVSLNHHQIFRSKYISDESHPEFNARLYVPIESTKQLLTLSLYDYQSVGKDRFIGSTQCTVEGLLSEIGEKRKYQFEPTEFTKWNLKDQRRRVTENFVNVSLCYVPTMPVFTPSELETVEAKEKELDEKKEEFEHEQAILKQEMSQSPNDWEVIEVDDPFEEDENYINSKGKLTLEELLTAKSGILTLQITKGKLCKPSAFLQILFDDIVFPSFISAKTRNCKLNSDTAQVFIRDLQHSTVNFRISKTQVTKDTDAIIAENTFKTLKLLKLTYHRPTPVKLNGSVVFLQCLFNPATIELPHYETVTDTGYLLMHIKSADNLLAADRNGKSDPYVDVLVNDQKVFTTAIVKKTLSPVWDEHAKIPVPSRIDSEVRLKLFDWDRAGDNDPLGDVVIDLESLQIQQDQDLQLPLDTQGTVSLALKFVPQYIKPSVEIKQSKLSSMPFKVVGNVAGVGKGVAGVGKGVAGAGIGAAAGGFHVGSKLIKKGLPGGSKKKKGNAIPEEDEEAAEETAPTQQSTKNTDDFDPTRPDMSTAPIAPNHLASSSSSSAQRTGSSPRLGSPKTSKTFRSDEELANITARNNLSPQTRTTAASTRRNSTVSSSARTLSPNSSYAGKITILAAENFAKPVQIRMSLIQKGAIKTIHKTKSVKPDADGVALYKDTATFRAAPESTIVFGATAIHRLSKDKDLGVTELSLADPQVHTNTNIAVKIGQGRVIVKIQYPTTS